jgi:malate dehydrogenase (oxaloacetate-decarboxylating)
MFSAAARVLSEFSPALTDTDAPLYPPLESVREISRKVAVAVGVETQQSGLTKTTSLDELERNVRDKMWSPDYVLLKTYLQPCAKR